MDTSITHLFSQESFDLARDKWLVTLSRLSLLLAESERLEDTLPSALQMVAELMGIDVVLLYWFDAEKGELELSAYRGVPPDFARMVDRMRVGEVQRVGWGAAGGGGRNGKRGAGRAS